jgi:heat shock protein HslJ
MIAFDRTAHTVSGYSGCNRFSNSYQRASDVSESIRFGAMAGTRMACVGPDLETPYLEALGRVQSYRITGQHLELLDAGGAVVARFEARNL